ncbi:hypothetical protein [Halopseudomonas pertucinogena]|uniref:hypothetical protein n=1 Tax=Halopseudomonas pertucinogena TaxID=86175 RepID=UPI00166EE6AF|nr:hypothetical protein [Halopseudomonas pertucinogena]
MLLLATAHLAELAGAIAGPMLMGMMHLPRPGLPFSAVAPCLQSKCYATDRRDGGQLRS